MRKTFELETKAGRLTFEAATHEALAGFAGRGNVYIHFRDIGSLAPMDRIPGGVQKMALAAVRAEYGARRDHPHWELCIGLMRMPWDGDCAGDCADWL